MQKITGSLVFFIILSFSVWAHKFEVYVTSDGAIHGCTMSFEEIFWHLN